MADVLTKSVHQNHKNLSLKAKRPLVDTDARLKQAIEAIQKDAKALSSLTSPQALRMYLNHIRESRKDAIELLARY